MVQYGAPIIAGETARTGQFALDMNASRNTGMADHHMQRSSDMARISNLQMAPVMESQMPAASAMDPRI